MRAELEAEHVSHPTPLPLAPQTETLRCPPPSHLVAPLGFLHPLLRPSPCSITMFMRLLQTLYSMSPFAFLGLRKSRVPILQAGKASSDPCRLSSILSNCSPVFMDEIKRCIGG